jgi:NADPH-dependent ferric siderophore reductase
MNQMTDMIRQVVTGRPAPRAWRLTVLGAEQVTPRVRNLTFTAPDLGEMDWAPGQDLVLNLPDAPRRHYTIRFLTNGVLAIDFVLHGHGAAAAWAMQAKPGDEIEALGPRGRTRLAQDADWHLFVGDETCLPAIFAMAETLPAGARAWAFLEVESEAERQAVFSPGTLHITWVTRGGPAAPDDLLLKCVQGFAAPAGRGHAYIIGETSGVRAQRQWLMQNGWDRDQITAEGYWRPGRVGGHDHV